VYNISNFHDHPGGTVILQKFAGKDVTEAWKSLHHPRGPLHVAKSYFLIGRLSPDSKVAQLRLDASSPVLPSAPVVTEAERIAIVPTLELEDQALCSSLAFITKVEILRFKFFVQKRCS
jgi:cytochrome b involved in lipid metabolism